MLGPKLRLTHPGMHRALESLDLAELLNQRLAGIPLLSQHEPLTQYACLVSKNDLLSPDSDDRQMCPSTRYLLPATTGRKGRKHDHRQIPNSVMWAIALPVGRIGEELIW
jgi:hypothetical protein